MRVLIDPGHAPGSGNRGPNGYREYAGMWRLSVFLQEILQSKSMHVQLTRLERQDPPLAERGGMARGFDLFISQHSNAFNGTVRGSECFFSVQQSQNRELAARLSAETARLFGHNDRGAKTRAGADGRDFFGVMRAAVAAGCPRVLLMESGFHDNPLDEAFLLQDANLRRLAQAQADIICDVLSIKHTQRLQAMLQTMCSMSGLCPGSIESQARSVCVQTHSRCSRRCTEASTSGATLRRRKP